jgi:hypothetical protein
MGDYCWWEVAIAARPDTEFRPGSDCMICALPSS